jgi:hypothetical protein
MYSASRRLMRYCKTVCSAFSFVKGTPASTIVPSFYTSQPILIEQSNDEWNRYTVA